MVVSLIAVRTFLLALPQAALACFLSSDEVTVIQAFIRLSTCCSVVLQPRLMRTAPRASAGATPIAASTCEACTVPDEQAAPDDTAIPLRSKAIIAVSAFRPGTVRQRGIGQPRRVSAENDRLRRKRSEFRLPADRATPPCAPASAARAASAAAQAAPKPAMAATFSVPARSAALLAAAADQRRGDMEVVASHQRAGALRAAELVRRQADQVGAERRSGCNRCARRPARRRHAAAPLAAWTMAAMAAIGWMTPVSLLASITDTSGRSARGQAAFQRGQIEQAVAGDRQLLDRLGRKTAAAAHRRVLDGGDEQPVARRLAAAELQRRRQRQHVGLGGAGGEGDVTGGPRRPGPRPARAAFSTSARAARPSAWTEEALPVRSSAASIAARASGRSGAVAFQSK